MGGPSNTSPQANVRSELVNYLRYVPAILQATSNVQPGIDTTSARSALNILQNFAPQAATAGQGLQASNTTAGANTVGNVINGQGANNVVAASALDRQINPEYYQTRSDIANKTGDLLNSVNLKGLSPGEAAAVERATAQTTSGTGNLGLINPTNVISNALNFGGAFNSKIPIAQNNISTATGTLGPSSSTGYLNAMGGALTQPPSSTGTNFGLASLPGAGNQAYSSGQGLLSNMGSIYNTNAPIAYQSSLANSAQGWSSQVGSASGLSSCCFIFLESYNGKLPWFVRALRDRYYEQEPEVATGYKQMAKWLVPLMRRSVCVRVAVNNLIVKPLTSYGAWLYGINRYGWVFKPIKEFWFGVWRKNLK